MADLKMQMQRSQTRYFGNYNSNNHYTYVLRVHQPLELIVRLCNQTGSGKMADPQLQDTRYTNILTATP